MYATTIFISAFLLFQIQPMIARMIDSSAWVLMTSPPLASPAITSYANKLRSNPKIRVWTDEYSNLFQVLAKKRFWE